MLLSAARSASPCRRRYQALNMEKVSGARSHSANLYVVANL
jgi:hypothetical protein